MNARELWTLLKAAVRGWFDDGAASMGAALAFYTLFSMAPLLLLIVALAGFVIGTDVAREHLVNQLTTLLGDKGAGAVLSVMEAAADRTEGVVAAVVSLATLVLGATTIFGELRRDLDIIWRHQAATGGGLKSVVRARASAIGMVLSIGFLLLVSLILSAAVSAFGSLWGGGFPGAGLVLRVLEFLGSFAVITGLFAMIYKILPSARIEWKDVWIGAAFTSLLFWIGKFLIGLYLGKSAVASPFGAAGTIVVVIVWVYYSAQIFLLGAEFTRAYALWRAKAGATNRGAP